MIHSFVLFEQTYDRLGNTAKLILDKIPVSSIETNYEKLFFKQGSKTNFKNY